MRYVLTSEREVNNLKMKRHIIQEEEEAVVTLKIETFFLYNINSARTIDGVTAILDI